MAMISLYGLHSLMVSVRFVAMMGGRMNLRPLDCKNFMHELYVVKMLILSWFCRNFWSVNMLWPRVILS